jgi:uncharacterized delta-60 repeat protein
LLSVISLALLTGVHLPLAPTAVVLAQQTPSLWIDDVSISEGDSGTKNAVFTVSLSAASSGPVSVGFSTADGAATSNTATFRNSAPISIPDSGNASPYPSPITVPPGLGTITNLKVVLHGFSHTWPRDADVMMVGPLGQTVMLMSDAGGASDVGVVTLIFDDLGPAMSSETLTGSWFRPTDFECCDPFSAPAPAGPYGSALAVFNGTNPEGDWRLFVVDDLGGLAGSISGGWSLIMSFAGADYVSEGGTLTIPAGATSGSISVRINGDVVPERAETFSVTLSSPSGAAIADGLAVGTITNDDGPALSIQDVSITEGNAGTKNAVFTVSLAGASTDAVSVDYMTADATATSNTTIFSNATSVSIPDGGNADPYPSTLTVPAGLGTISNLRVVLHEFSHVFPADVDVLLVGPTGQTLMLMSDVGGGYPGVSGVTLTFSDEGAALSGNFGADYVPTTGTYKPTDVGSDDTFGAPAPPGPYGSALAAFNGTDPQGEWRLFVVDDVGIDAGSISGWSLIISSGGGDYVSEAGTLTIPAGATSGNISVTINGDALPEAHETFMVTLSNPSRATIADGLAFGTIMDDDGPALSIHDVSVSEGNIGTKNAVFTVSMTNPSSAPVSVNYATANGTAVGDAVSFHNTASIRIPDSGDAGNAAPYPSTITVPPGLGTISKLRVMLHGFSHEYPDDVDILLVGPTGQTSMLMSNVGGSFIVSDLTLIFDDDGPVLTENVLTSGTYRPTNRDDTNIDDSSDTFGPPAPPGPYGSALAVFNGTNPQGEWRLFAIDDFVIDVGGISGGWSLVVSSAGGDYVSSVGTLTIPPGATSGNIAVTINGEIVPEPHETFTVTLSAPTGATVADGLAVGTITNDDNPPSAPTITDITPGNTQLTVAFTPGADGGSPLTRYEYSQNGEPFTPTNPLLPEGSFVIAGLQNGTQYQIRLRAVNAVGAGAESNTVPGTPVGPPTAPAITSISPASGQLTVAFTAAGDSGSPLTRYEYSRNGEPFTPTDPLLPTGSFVIAGLQNGTQYQIRLRAVNAVGVGPESNTVSGTPIGPPTAPAITSITAGREQLTVAFTAAGDGGSPLTRYEYSRNGESFTPTNPLLPTGSLVIAGLQNGTEYQIRLRAVNAIGVGPESNTVAGTPIGPPTAPAITSITAGIGQLTVAFTPAGSSGSPITRYEYSRNGEPFTATSPLLPAGSFVIAGLQDGTQYQIRLRAVNAVGAGAESNTVPGTTIGAPGAPTITGIRPGNTQLSVEFLAGADGGSAITNYKYSIDGGASWSPRAPAATTSPLVINGLSTNTTYPVQIRAVNAIGDGAPSASAMATPLSSIDETIDDFAPVVDGDVRSIAVQADGKILIGGEFDMVGSTPRNRLARLDASGAIDPAFNAGAGIAAGSIVTSAREQADRKILITTEGPIGRHIARFNASGTPDDNRDDDPAVIFEPFAREGDVFALGLQADGRIVVGGSFHRLGHQFEQRDVTNEPRHGIGRVRPGGELDLDFKPDTDGTVHAILVQPTDGRILVAGQFNTLAGAARQNIGRLNVDGTLDHSFTPGAFDGVIKALALQDGKILVGGAFTTIGGITRHNIARLTAEGAVDPGFAPGPRPGGASVVEAILPLLSTGKVLIGGAAVAMEPHDEGPRHLARLNPDGSFDATFEAKPEGKVLVLALQPADGKILVGGEFVEMNGQPRSRVARLGAAAPSTSIPPAPFTDEQLVVGVTVLKAEHILELRTRINAVRQRFGLAVSAWTNPALEGVVPRAEHILELRAALLDAYTAAVRNGVNVTFPVFVDSALAGLPIRRVHIQQLRDAVRVLEGL